MNLYQLELFLAIAEHGSFSRAAQQLRISQPAISDRIRALEDSLGEQLFDRVGRRMYLTDAGQELRIHAQLILQQVAEARQAVAEMQGLEQGRLRVVATTTIGTHILLPVLGEFHRTYPGISLVVDITNEARAVQLLRDRQMDLAILGLAEQLNDMIVEYLMPNELFVAAAHTHPLAGRGAIPFEEFATYPLLVREEGAGTRTVIDQAFAARQMQPNIAIELRQAATIKQGIIAGLGLGVLSRQGAAGELAASQLVALDVEGMTIRRDWHVIYRRQRHLPHAAAAFKNMLLSYARGHRSEAEA